MQQLSVDQLLAGDFHIHFSSPVLRPISCLEYGFSQWDVHDAIVFDLCALTKIKFIISV